MDPFTGSGTTAVVAHALGRRFIGTEFGPGNAKSAMERIEAGPVHLGKIIGVSTAIQKKRKTLDEFAG
jgi:DNA modification methylase